MAIETEVITLTTTPQAVSPATLANDKTISVGLKWTGAKTVKVGGPKLDGESDAAWFARAFPFVSGESLKLYGSLRELGTDRLYAAVDSTTMAVNVIRTGV